MKANNTIHINGKLYDARTGELINKVKSPAVITTPKLSAPKNTESKSRASHRRPPQSATKKRGNGFVDGIAKNPKATTHSSNKSVAIKKNPPRTKSRATHSVAPVHRNLKHSSTLNRSGVRAPQLTAPEAKDHNSAEKKTSKPPLKRLERAKSINKSEVISRFSRPKDLSKNNNNSPEVRLSMKNVANAAEKTRSAKTTGHQKHKLISESLSVDHSATKKIKSPNVKHSPKIFHFVSAGVAAVVLFGYVTYLNVPSVSMKVASSRAGFSATLPGQTPAGYKMQGPIAYSPGQVVINFGSNTDDRHFTIQQQPTSWDSEALKENYVAKQSSAEPLTYNDRGLTVYLYNGGDAAWIDAGKFYSIKAENSQLDTNQILDLATSM